MHPRPPHQKARFELFPLEGMLKGEEGKTYACCATKETVQSTDGRGVFAIQREMGIPVKLVGLGETADDLVDFDPDEFVEALF